MSTPLTGDQTQVGKQKNTVVCFTGLASRTTAQLTDKTDVINNTRLSGKKLGALVLNSTTGEVMVAQGSTDVALWNNAGPVAANITPV